MAETQGKCSNFGNCSRAGETIYVANGGDFVCPECHSSLVAVRGKHSMHIRPLRVGGVLALCAAIAGIALQFMWHDEPNLKPNAEGKFLAHFKIALHSDPKGMLPPDKLEELKTYATDLKLLPDMDRLIMKGKRDYLLERKAHLENERMLFSSPEFQRLCKQARLWRVVLEGCGTPIEEALAYLYQGEFAEAKDLLKSEPNDPQARRLLDEIETPLAVQVSLQYKKEGRETSAVFPLDSKDLSDLTLTGRDSFKFFISPSHDKVFVYVFQLDVYGDIKRVFPDPVWSRALSNPIQSGMAYQIPTEHDWLFLDELPSWQEDLIIEYFYMIASPWKANDIEQMYGNIHESTDPGARKTLIDAFLSQLQRRKNSPIRSVFYREFSFQHGK